MSEILMPSQTGHDLPVLHDGIEWRFLASIPSPQESKCFAKFGDAHPVIPRAQWKPAKRVRNEVPILDQNGRGACVGHGAATGGMLARSIQGFTFQLLSAPFVYAQINGGRDAGSSPSDAAKILQTMGVCLMSEFPEPEYLKRNVPASAYNTAKRFTFDVYQCETWDEAMTAWYMGYSLFDTVRCGWGFNNLNKYGVPTIAYGAGNHCTAWGDEIRDIGGELAPVHRNSWTTGWGENGCFTQPESHAKAQGQWYECYAVRAANPDPQDVVVPPSRG